MNHILGNKQLQLIVASIAILLPFLLAIANLLFQNLILWYDPARDLLLALDNLSKPTLIGPTTGISGLFYGPYWIWLLSLGLLFSNNPIIVTFIVATLSYCFLFPWIWFKFYKYFDRTSLIVGWLLFMFSNGILYATQLWNPYPAPLIALGTIYLLLIADLTKTTRKQIILKIIVGFLTGLLINFHISFGIAFLASVLIFIVTYTLINFFENKKRKRKYALLNTLISVGSVGCGLLIAFLPILFFESRHGFHQLSTLFDTFTKFGGVVIIQGLSKALIAQTFFATFAQLVHLPTLIAEIFLAILFVVFITLLKQRKIAFEEKDLKILLLIASLFAGVLLIYFTARNPIWQYHFIGVDIIFLLLLTFFSSKLPLLKKMLIIIALFSIGITIFHFIQNVQNGPSKLLQEENTVKTISTDAKNSNYGVYAYSPSIYIYEYSYLFYWLAHKNIPYDPGLVNTSPKLLYLIVPSKKNNHIRDFISYRAPISKYISNRTWTVGTFTVIKYTIR